MIHTRNLVLLLLLPAFGCSESTEPISKPTVPDQGSVTLTVSVAGEPTLLTSLFTVRFNNIEWSNIQPNETVRVPLVPGDYSIRLSPLRDIEWCSAVAPTTLSARVEAGKVQTVQFRVDCPPLVGTATIRVVVAAFGAQIPAQFGFSLGRVIGPKVVRSATVRANDSTDVTVPVGIYQLSLPNQSNCSVGNGFDFLIARTLLVRAGEAARARYAITCRATP